MPPDFHDRTFPWSFGFAARRVFVFSPGLQSSLFYWKKSLDHFGVKECEPVSRCVAIVENDELLE